jgi:hypothetical protein
MVDRGSAQEQSTFEDGWLSGLSLREQASDCPFDHASPKMRAIWLSGFSHGRSSAPTGEEQMAAEFEARDFIDQRVVARSRNSGGS